MAGLEHWVKFRPDEMMVAESASWLAVVREKQVTLGSLVVLLRRPASSFGDVTSDEMGDFPALARRLEQSLGRTFGAEKFNYIAAMMKDPYIHFHLFPRYSREQNRYGRTWSDDAWPKAIVMTDVPFDEALNLAIRDDLRRDLTR